MFHFPVRRFDWHPQKPCSGWVVPLVQVFADLARIWWTQYNEVFQNWCLVLESKDHFLVQELANILDGQFVMSRRPLKKNFKIKNQNQLLFIGSITRTDIDWGIFLEYHQAVIPRIIEIKDQ